MKRTIMFCDVCDAEMERDFTIIAWDLCPACIYRLRQVLHEWQDANRAVS